MECEIPYFLTQMSEQMLKQDNQGFAAPLFQVMAKTHVEVDKEGEDTHTEIRNEFGQAVFRSYVSESFEDFAEYMFRCHRDWCDEWASDFELTDKYSKSEFVNSINTYYSVNYDALPSGMKVVYCKEVGQLISIHFTEADANLFIKNNQQNFFKLYVHVESAEWSPQMRDLRKWILNLTR